MSQGARFMKSVLIKTCWLTPVVVTVNDLVGGPATVHGRSMQPTLNPLGSTSIDLVLVDKLSIRLFKYSRGDVVLLRSPVCPDAVLIKRLVALEGDWLTLPDCVDIAKIPQGHCWVEGDNPELSEDSRNKYGPVPLALIEGRVTHVLWPPSRLSRIPPVNPHRRLLMQNSFALKER
ncbi:hypothetical protein ABBQ38_007495 [Trebouxia sp. C0009 RCD-2024]